jgi:hypothetical protein
MKRGISPLFSGRKPETSGDDVRKKLILDPGNLVL